MGPLEILVVLLVAFILLGPEKMVDGARLLGRAAKEIRRLTDELPKIVLDEEPVPSTRTASTREDRKTGEDADEPDDGETAADGPVAFRPSGTSTPADSVESTQDQGR